MQWLFDIFFTPSVGQSILLLALTIAAGLYIGQFKIKGVSLGVTWVLFIGLLLSHFGMVPDASMMTFIKDFGLILFVYAIGLQVGPSFFSSLKEGGLKLNIVAIIMIVMACVTAGIVAICTNTPLDVMTGIMTGAVTNTPSLGAAQQTLKDAGSTNSPMLSSAYAVAYPLAVVSIIFVPIIMRKIMHIDADKEECESKSAESSERERIAVKVTQIDGLTVEQFAKLFSVKFTISRVMHEDGKEEHVSRYTIINKGDILRIVIGKGFAPEFVDVIGVLLNDKDIPWENNASNLVSKRIVVTRPEIQGRTIGELQLGNRYNVTITGVKRASVDLMASASLKLQMGDRVLVVGDADNVERCADRLGNSLKRLDMPNLIPIFTGIVLGILVGIIPIKFPGIPQPVKLGLAGGPLIISILIARFGPVYKVVTYATTSALMMLREIGICLFLGAVGLTSGAGFVDTIVNGGYMWILYGLIITIVPIVIGFLVARLVYKMPYYTIVGLISGSYTDPPALAFANASTETDRPAVAYATVYPLTMFLRIFAGEIMVLIALSL